MYNNNAERERTVYVSYITVAIGREGEEEGREGEEEGIFVVTRTLAPPSQRRHPGACVVTNRIYEKGFFFSSSSSSSSSPSSSFSLREASSIVVCLLPFLYITVATVRRSRPSKHAHRRILHMQRGFFSFLFFL